MDDLAVISKFAELMWKKSKEIAPDFNPFKLLRLRTFPNSVGFGCGEVCQW